MQTKELNRIIKANVGNSHAVADALRERTRDKPEELIPFLNRIKPYFSVEELKGMFSELFEKDPVNVIRYGGSAREFFTDSSLRRQLFEQYKKTPWEFYTHAQDFEDLFPSMYFENLFRASPDLFNDRNYQNLFLIYFAGAAIEAFDPGLRAVLEESLGEESLEVRVGESKEPGFSCGGLETNYLRAIELGDGVCKVNDHFLAKLFHRRGEAKKVTFVSDASYMTEGGYVVWENVIYAPSNGQEAIVRDSIGCGETDITIPEMIIRPVRPLIDLTSKEIFAKYDSR